MLQLHRGLALCHTLRCDLEAAPTGSSPDEVLQMPSTHALYTSRCVPPMLIISLFLTLTNTEMETPRGCTQNENPATSPTLSITYA